MSSTISTRRARRQHVRQQQHYHQQQQQQQTPSPSFLQDSPPKDASLPNNNRLIKISTKYSHAKDNERQPILARCTRHSSRTLRQTNRGINHCGSIVWSLALALFLGTGILRRDAGVAAIIFKPDSSRLHSVVSGNMPQLNNSGEQEHLAAIRAGVNSIGGVIVATTAPHLPDTFGSSATAIGSSAEDNTINNTLQSFSIIDELAAAAAAANAMGGESRELQSLMPLRNQPIFDFGMARNITGRTGQSEAIIKCRVDQLDDKSVSWIRKRDLHILSVGTATYTSDKRFEVTESKDSREWSLHVRNPQARDSGIYECQVNTEPKISMAFSLNILEIPSDARAIITGPPDLHFKTGSAIILNCNVEQPTLKDIGPIYWYRGNQLLTPVDDENEVDSNGGDGNGDNMPALTRNASEDDFAARLSMQSDLGDTMKSRRDLPAYGDYIIYDFSPFNRLRIANARTTDTGNYTCQPTTASGTSVMVHVLNDEKPAAMQKSSAPCLAMPSNTFYMCVFAALLLVLAAGFPKCVLYRYVLGSLTLPTAFVLVALRVVLLAVCDEGLLIGMAYICWRIVTTIEPNFLQYPKG